MAFTSALYPGEPIIIDANAAPPTGQGRGRIPRDYDRQPFGSLGFASPFKDEWLIPRSEWPALIEEKERLKNRISDHLLNANIASLDQNGTNYCWAHGPTTAMVAIRCMAGDPYVLLSAASVAAPIKGFRNQGGWGGEAVEWIVEHGIADVSHWPLNKISRQYYNDETKANALTHRITEWVDLRPNNFDQVASLVLRNIPVAVGYNWWSHEVCGCDLVLTGAERFGLRIRNSWSDSYGAKGFAVLEERKATPSDAVAPLVTLPSP
jgi:hypothetical protein